MINSDRIFTSSHRVEDVNAALLLKMLDAFVGQRAACENLRMYVEAAK